MTDAHDDTATPVCHQCGALLRRGEGAFYVVRIEAYADPTPPHVNEDDLDNADSDLADLIEQMNDRTEQELLDQVYRRLTIELCPRCYTKWIENPTG